MNKKVKNFIIVLYVFMIILVIFLILSLFTEFGANMIQTIFASKHYIQFDDLEKVTVCYKSDDFATTSVSNHIYCEVEVTDKEFLNLLEDKYQNKIVNDYETNILSKGKYKIIINDNIELCTAGYDVDGFCLDYNGRWLLVKYQPEIYEKMVEIIETELDKSSF